jgi:hypothetical protein
MKNTINREFLTAVLVADLGEVERLKDKIKLAGLTPSLVLFEIKDGLYCLDWKGLKLTRTEFEQLIQDSPKTVFWEEIKTYPATA